MTPPLGKHVLLMRHASAASMAASDRERPLTIAGRQEADLMGQMLSLRGPRPELVISSGAARATETARIVGRWLGLEDDLAVAPQLYLASVDQWLATLQETDAGLSTVLMVGHNPGLADFARRLRGGGRPIDAFDPAHIASLDLPVRQWALVQEGKALCRWSIGPREAAFLTK